ncbi:hypothetical protein HDU76_008990 [Blyttiomyces sp. JEL0837]|nr:hypothetical protein HDU76_008990 [Blyttiomyces sp. JEL0837]
MDNKKVPAGHAFSKDTIKKKQEDEMQGVVYGEHERKRVNALRYSKRLKSHLYTNVSILTRDREHGLIRNASRTAWETMMFHLTRRHQMKLPLHSGRINDFAIHPTTNYVCTSLSRTLSIFPVCQRKTANDDFVGFEVAHPHPFQVVESSEISSVRYGYCDATTVIVTTSIGGSAQIYTHATPNFDDNDFLRAAHLCYRFSPRTSIWTSSIATPHNETVISAGGTGKAYVLTKWDSGDTMIQTFHLPNPVDILSQCWDGTGNVLYNGCRDGSIQAFDRRMGMSQRSNQIQSQILPSSQYRSPICDIKLPFHDKPQVLSTAFNGSICLWDVRYLKPSTKTTTVTTNTHVNAPNPKSKFAFYSNGNYGAEGHCPIVEFFGNRNAATKINTEVIGDSGVIACAGDNGFLRTWSLPTSNQLNMIDLHGTEKWGRTVKFMKSRSSGGNGGDWPMGLWVSGDQRLEFISMA